MNIEAEETAPTTVNATPIRTRRLFSQASAGAKKFLDHTLVNTASPTDSEGSKDPETPEIPTNPDKPKSDNGAKTDTKVKTTTTAKNLANTGDQTFALVASRTYRQPKNPGSQKTGHPGFLLSGDSASGNCIPQLAPRPGRTFPKGPQRETASHN